MKISELILFGTQIQWSKAEWMRSRKKYRNNRAVEMEMKGAEKQRK